MLTQTDSANVKFSNQQKCFAQRSLLMFQSLEITLLHACDSETESVV